MNKDYEDFSEFDDFLEDDDDDELDFGGNDTENNSELNESYDESSSDFCDNGYNDDDSDFEYENTQQNVYNNNQYEDDSYQDDYSEEQYEYETKPYDSGYDTSDEGIEDDVNTDEPKPDMILYIVIDKYIEGLINYMRESGLNVSRIFKNIADARDELIMQTEPYRLVVVETGLGRFTSTSQRKEIIDLLGICTDEDSRASVFYTDSVLKIDVIRELGKDTNIKWEKYKNTALTVVRLLKLHENFVLSDEQNLDTFKSEKECMEFTGLTSREQVSKGIQPIITSESVLKGMVLTDDGTPLEEYDPLY
ncbi:MAG: hypothetical protein J6A59_10565 [Lachnospiraceae bacterium]|nr:hypothetical protein [Lachnospiraceae bacterium]